MKTKLVLLLGLIGFLCTAQAQNQTRFQLPDFTNLNLLDYFNVILVTSDSSYIQYNSKSPLVCSFNVSNNTLTIASPSISKTISSSVQREWITVGYKELRAINISGVATLKCKTPLRSDFLSLSLDGAAKMTLAVETPNLNTEIAGAASLTLTGEASQHSLYVAGAASINALGLSSNTTSVDLSGTCKVKLNATTITGEASGMSFIEAGALTQNLQIENTGLSRISRTKADGSKEKTTVFNVETEVLYVTPNTPSPTTTIPLPKTYISQTIQITADSTKNNSSKSRPQTPSYNVSILPGNNQQPHILINGNPLNHEDSALIFNYTFVTNSNEITDDENDLELLQQKKHEELQLLLERTERENEIERERLEIELEIARSKADLEQARLNYEVEKRALQTVSQALSSNRNAQTDNSRCRGCSWSYSYESFNNRCFDAHWSGFEIGFNGYGSPDKFFGTAMPSGYESMQLRFEKSIQFNWNVIDFSFGFGNSGIGIASGLGFSWNIYRFLDRSATINPSSQNFQIAPYNGPESRVFDRSRLSASYFRIPLLLEFQSRKTGYMRDFFFQVGIVGSVRMQATSYSEYTIDGNEMEDKNRGDFYLAPFRADVEVRLGFGPLRFFASYGITQLFMKNKGPELTPYCVGLTIFSF